MNNANLRRRRRVERLAMAGCVALTGLALIPLLSILSYVVWRGSHRFDWHFFTRMPAPVGEAGGGMANAIYGTLLMVGMAAAIGIPAGILAGVYLAEYGRGSFARAVRFIGDVAAGIPSIVVGIFVYTLIVRAMGRFSAIAGAVALAIIMLPIVTRTAEEMLRLVPRDLREAALALGVPYWRVVLRVLLPTARAGLTTGCMLAVARAAGETAPWLFTALGHQFWQSRLDQPIASLPVQIYRYAIGPYADWHDQAWTGALILILLVLVTSILARVAGRGART